MRIFSFKSSCLILLLFFSLFVLIEGVEAKVLPQSKKSAAKTSTVSKSSNTTGIGVSPRVRGDKKALVVNFSNLHNATAVSYLLTYTSNGQEEGAMGGLNLTGSSSQKSELLFGTCSKNVCRYHSNIKNAKLEVSYTSKTGKKYLKKYKIKV